MPPKLSGKKWLPFQLRSDPASLALLRKPGFDLEPHLGLTL